MTEILIEMEQKSGTDSVNNGEDQEVSNDLKSEIGKTKDDTKIFLCDICSRKFNRKYTLKIHQRSHTQNNPFRCTSGKCTKAFKTSSDLNRHILVHTNVRKFSCDECNLQFKLKIHLTNHKKCHTDVKEWKCSYCEKWFRTKLSLQNHELIHTDEKPHECSVCGLSFREFSTLSKHLKTHEIDTEVYVCSICKKVFRKLRTLTNHMLRKHKVLMNDDNLVEVHSMEEFDDIVEKPEKVHKDMSTTEEEVTAILGLSNLNKS